ncbi:MAG: hypothetical protein IIB00_07495 [candidate division Zixibacteria bacterium]|nr:hypothetical protein [candidate division Zixibacteria bacterium]
MGRIPSDRAKARDYATSIKRGRREVDIIKTETDLAGLNMDTNMTLQVTFAITSIAIFGALFIAVQTISKRRDGVDSKIYLKIRLGLVLFAMGFALQAAGSLGAAGYGWPSRYGSLVAFVEFLAICVGLWFLLRGVSDWIYQSGKRVRQDARARLRFEVKSRFKSYTESPIAAKSGVSAGSRSTTISNDLLGSIPGWRQSAERLLERVINTQGVKSSALVITSKRNAMPNELPMLVTRGIPSVTARWVLDQVRSNGTKALANMNAFQTTLRASIGQGGSVYLAICSDTGQPLEEAARGYFETLLGNYVMARKLNALDRTLAHELKVNKVTANYARNSAIQLSRGNRYNSNHSLRTFFTDSLSALADLLPFDTFTLETADSTFQRVITMTRETHGERDRIAIIPMSSSPTLHEKYMSQEHTDAVISDTSNRTSDPVWKKLFEMGVRSVLSLSLPTGADGKMFIHIGKKESGFFTSHHMDTARKLHSHFLSRAQFVTVPESDASVEPSAIETRRKMARSISGERSEAAIGSYTNRAYSISGAVSE